jgi:EAL domain-containing protein (putative c-di-GMP-specific phosphodiesterase class I)/PAS domain-containing protein
MPNGTGSRTPLRVLVADSRAGTAATLDALLRNAGFATRIQTTDLNHAPAFAETADLLFCDAAAPALEAAVQRVRSTAPALPVLLVEHREDGIDAAAALAWGADDVVRLSAPDHLTRVFRREAARIADRHAAEALRESLQEAEARAELLLQGTTAAVAYVHEGMHIHANASYLQLFGLETEADILGLPLIDLADSATAEALRTSFRRHPDDKTPNTFAFRGNAMRYPTVSGEATLTPARYDGEACLQVAIRTVTEPSANARAETIATPPPDGATQASPASGDAAASEPASGLTDVSAFLAEAASLFANPTPCMAVLVVQIDQFARLQVDQGLRRSEATAARVYDAVRTLLAGYPVQRLAPHQFVAALRQRDRGYLRASCEELVRKIGAQNAGDGASAAAAQVSIGAGLIETPGQAPGPDRIEVALDLALGTAVRMSLAGGQRYELVGGSLDAELPETESGRMLARINRAIEQDSFRLVYQPIVSLRGDANEHYEVFMRMVDAEGREFRPDGFLGTAIEHGVAGKIDRWVILRAIRALLVERAKGHDTRLTINVSANSIIDPDFPTWLHVALKTTRLPTDAVIIQFTERDVLDLTRQARHFAEALRAMHCMTSLSRFGVNDDGFARLEELPVDFVKLDGALIEGMGNDAAARESVVQILGRLQQLGKLSVVPVVETASMLSLLWQGGANFVQGNYLQPPGPEMNFDFNPSE